MMVTDAALNFITWTNRNQRKANFVLILYHTNCPSRIKVQKRQQPLKGK